jgi:hypothetical protein
VKYIAPPLSEAVHDVNEVFKSSEVPDINTPYVLLLLNDAYIAPPFPLVLEQEVN